MDFTRKKQKGVRQEAMKVWYSPCGNYRVSWVAEVQGVTVTPHYFACVRCYNSPHEDREFWNFAGKRGTYRVMHTAVEACEKHERLWQYAMKMSETERKGRNERLRAIVHRARIGNGVLCNSVMDSLPTWVRPIANTILMNQLFPRMDAHVDRDEDDVELPTGQVAELIDDAELTAMTDLSTSSDDSGIDEQDDEEEPAKPTPAAKPAAVAAVSAPVAKAAAKKPAAKAEKKPAKKAAAKKPTKKKAKSK